MTKDQLIALWIAVYASAIRRSSTAVAHREADESVDNAIKRWGRSG